MYILRKKNKKIITLKNYYIFYLFKRLKAKKKIYFIFILF